MVEVINVWREHFIPTFAIEDLDEKIAARELMFVEGGKMDTSLKAISKIFEQSNTGWLANTEDMTIADIKGFMDTFMMFSGQFDGVVPKMLLHYPVLLKFHEKMSNDERVKNYYDNEDESRWVFRPGAFDDIKVSNDV